jgi:hypothetical protein
MNDPHSPARPALDPRCAALHAVVQELVDGDGLTAEAAHVASEHLESCAGCRTLVARQRAYRAACERVGCADRAPASLRAHIEGMLARESLSIPR